MSPRKVVLRERIKRSLDMAILAVAMAARPHRGPLSPLLYFLLSSCLVLVRIIVILSITLHD